MTPPPDNWVSGEPSLEDQVTHERRALAGMRDAYRTAETRRVESEQKFTLLMQSVEGLLFTIDSMNTPAWYRRKIQGILDEFS